MSKRQTDQVERTQYNQLHNDLRRAERKADRPRDRAMATALRIILESDQQARQRKETVHAT